MSPQELLAKKKDLEMLKKWAEMGIITLMYLDESGCYPQSPLVYSYGKVGRQKIVVQNQRRGRRINLMGLWENNQKLEYGMLGANFNTEAMQRGLGGSPHERLHQDKIYSILRCPSQKSGKKTV
ncbi:hypothetical protein BJP36_37980 [Moorena producens JHB]|uniref:Transposase n=1 Tax=Moorena producens (strain JHB) TaxID=1454205 RepID=A0A9Q9SUH1_MOOP1|nr:hypothetical protein [Moorena producens]WAN69884.1 hypothetical protein BJP36_37980 [Moorena producens JHB]